MASHQQARKQTTKAQEEEGGQAQGRGARVQQGQAMNLENIGKYRAEAQQRSVDAIRAAEERFNKANQQARAHGTAASFQEGAKQQEESHGCGGGHGAAGHAGTEAKQWLADAASDARERCNRATGMGTNPTAAHGGNKGTAAHSYAGATAASRGQETKKSSTEQEGGQGRGHLTRQGVMGHGRDADKISDAEAARAALEKHDKGKQAGAATGQQQSAKDAASYAVDAGARGERAAAGKTQEATQQATGTAVDYTKQTAAKAKDVTASAAGTTMDYAKQAAAKTKDVTLAAGGTTAEYAKQAAVKAKDATVSTGGTAAEYAKAAAEKAKEAAVATAKTTAGYTQQTAVKAKDVTVATGAQVAQKAKEVTADTAHKVAEYAKEKAEQGKEAAARTADQAEEPGSDATAEAKDSTAHMADKARDVTVRRQHEDTSGDVARRAGGTAEQTKDKVKDATGSMAQKVSDAAGRVKDTAKDAAGGVEQRSRETGAQARDKARDTASHAAHKAGEAKHRASSETGMTGGGATAKAKGSNGEEEGTTIVGDVLEAVGATVVGLAQHTKGLIAGEEEVVPGDVVGAGEAKFAGAKEEKRKTA